MRTLGALPIFLCLALWHSAANAGIITNRLGNAGAGIAFSSGTAIEVVPGNTARHDYCVKATENAMCVWTPPSTADTAPGTAPSATVGYPLDANTDYCFAPPYYTVQALLSRMDCFNTSGSSGTFYTRESQ